MARSAFRFLLVCLCVVWVWPTQASERGQGPEPRWQEVRLTPSGAGLPVRLVDYDEPWAQVVHEVHERFGALAAKRHVRVGFYGHGAFVPPESLLQDVPFVAALGLSAEMDVMIFPRWRFPQKHPFTVIPRAILHELIDAPLHNPAETIGSVVRRHMQQLALENQAATAHAAVRLAEGIHAFHTRRMPPALAAFSNSAMVIVRLGDLLERGAISDGQQMLTLPEDVREAGEISHIVMFGFPLPNGTVATALRQRVRGAIVNVIPGQCWNQLGGNFPLQGPVENIPVSWAPTHAGWPRLAPQSSAVAILGAFLGGRHEAGRLAAQMGLRTQGVGQWVQTWQDTLCGLIPNLAQFLEKPS